MSGPKYAELFLALELERKLAEKRRLEAERIKKEIENSKENIDRVINDIYEVRDRLEKRIAEVKDLPNSNHEYSCLVELYNKIPDYELLTANTPNDLSKLTDVLRKLESDKKAIISDLGRTEERILHNAEALKITNVNVRADNENDLNYKFAEVNAKAAVEKQLQSELKEYKSAKEFVEQIDNHKSYRKDSVRSIKAIFDQMKELIEVDADNSGTAEESEYAMNKKTDINIDKKKRMLHELRTNFIFEKNIIVKEEKRMMSAYEEYAVLAKQLYGKVDLCVGDFESSSEIEAIIINLKEEIAEKEKLDYIAKCLSEVMKKKGHDIVSYECFTSVCASSGSKDDNNKNDGTDMKKVNSRKEYYTFGKGSVLTVTTSDTGAIMMEVAVVGDDKAITNQEREKAVNEMLCFCDQYPEIVEELEAMGIRFEKKNNMPPISAFAKKVDASVIDPEEKVYKRNNENSFSGSSTGEKNIHLDDERRKNLNNKTIKND